VITAQVDFAGLLLRLQEITPRATLAALQDPSGDNRDEFVGEPDVIL